MNKYTKVLLFFGLCIYLIHMEGSWVAQFYQDENDPEFGNFSILTLKGDQGYTVDMAVYASQIKDTYRHNNFLFQKDPFVKENQQEYFPNGNIIYFLAALPLHLGFEIDAVHFISSFFAILLSILLLRMILKQEYPDEELNNNIGPLLLITGLLFLGIYGKLPNDFLSLLMDGDILPRNLGYNGRFPHIQFSLFLLLFWYYRLVKFLKTFDVLNAVLLGFSIAVLQYSYFYFWTGAIVFSGLIILMHLGEKLKQLFSKEILFPLTAAAGVYIVLTIPFWWNFVAFNCEGFAKEFTARVGMVHGRFLKILITSKISMLIIVGGVIMDYWLSRKNNNGVFSFWQFLAASKKMIAIGLSLFVLKNLQLILGYTVQAYHWEVAFIYPILMIISFDYIIKIQRHLTSSTTSPRPLKILKSLGLIVFLWTVLGAMTINFIYGQKWAKYFAFTKTEQELLHYIKENMEDKVFMSNNININAVIAANTDNYLFVSNAFITHNNNQEIVERIVWGYKALGYDLDNLKKEILKGEQYLSYLNDVRTSKIYKNEKLISIPDNYTFISYIGHVTYLDKEEKFYSSKKLMPLVIQTFNDPKSTNKYDLDFLVIYKRYFIGTLPTTTPIFDNKDFVIYSVSE
jgi:hypothetical protein